jgi:serine/threonine-protein kinase
MESVDRFLELQPPTSEIEGLAGAILRRKGETEAALGRFKRGVELDPRSSNETTEVGITAYILRRHDEAETLMKRALALQPDSRSTFNYLAANRLRADGDTARAREWLEQSRTAGVYDPVSTEFSFVELALAARQPDQAIAESEQMTGPLDNQFVYMPPTLLRALALHQKGDRTRAEAAFDSARVDLEASVEADPTEPRFRSALGVALAGLGRKEEALREGEEGVRLMPPEKEAWRGNWRVFQLARIETMVGESESAIERLEYLLSIPFDLTPAELRIDLAWDPLRGNPRFEELLR